MGARVDRRFRILGVAVVAAAAAAGGDGVVF